MMNVRNLYYLAVFCLVTCVTTISAQSIEIKEFEWFDELSNQEISLDWGKPTLSEGFYIPPRHAESEHFVYHYERSVSKFARRAEKIYEDIMEFMGNPEDLMGDKKSHIFILPDYDRWLRWTHEVAKIQGLGGVCRGNELFFPGEDRRGKFDSRAKLLNHEMTHLVFNRIFPNHVPTWLNEGVAEYFGARENMSTNEFRRVMGRRKGNWDLDELTKYTHDYGSMTGDVLTSFYGEAAMFVDFLTHKHEKELLPKLIESTMEGGTIQKAAVEIYGYESYEALKEDYEKYRKKFE